MIETMSSSRLKNLLVVCATVLTRVLVSAGSAPDATPQTINIIVVSYDPLLREHDNLHLHRYMKWNDPRPMTTNLVRYIREASRGYANYRIVDFIDVDAFPVKR